MASKTSPLPASNTKRVHWITSSRGHNATFIPHGQMDTITIHSIKKTRAQEQMHEHEDELQGSVIVILLIADNNIPSNDPLPDKKTVVDALIELFDWLNGIGVWAVHICEIMPHYPYNFSPQDVKSKEMSSLTEKINRCLTWPLQDTCGWGTVLVRLIIWPPRTCITAWCRWSQKALSISLARGRKRMLKMTKTWSPQHKSIPLLPSFHSVYTVQGYCNTFNCRHNTHHKSYVLWCVILMMS